MRGASAWIAWAGIGCTASCAAAPAQGSVCIASFARVQGPIEQMLMDRPPPGPQSSYTLTIDGRDIAGVDGTAPRRVDGVRADRRIRVRVRLGSRATESFPIDLRESPRRNACLRLRSSYWNWQVDYDPSPVRGCDCG